MRRPSRTSLSWVLVLGVPISLAAQDIEAIGRGKPLTFSGGFSLNQIYYHSRGIAARRTPFSFVATGHANLSIYGWSVPVQFTVTEQRRTVSQPFNRYVLHPKWKWIKAHAGYTSVSFSPYTVNGHVFRGIAVDLDPGKHWQVSALYGRFMKATSADSLRTTIPSFQRTGYGLKARYGREGNQIELTAFQAEDDPHSIASPPDSLRLKPEQNVALSVGGSALFFKRLAVKAEFATSAFTRDITAPSSPSGHPLTRVPGFTRTTSTSFYDALKASLDYRGKGWSLGMGYERIDPEYQTLGAYYFNNDLRHVSLNGSITTLAEKLTVSLSGGLQNDNVDKTKISMMRRLVTACNVHYNPSQKFDASLSWSTFQTSSNVRPWLETSIPGAGDTLSFIQTTRNASLSATYAPGSRTEGRQHITLNITWQEASDTQHQQLTTTSAFTTITAGYVVSPRQNMTAALSCNASLQTGAFTPMHAVSPSASVTRSYFNQKFRTTASASWTRAQYNLSTTMSVVNGRLTGTLVLSAKHNFTVSAILASRRAAEATRVTELTLTAGYQYAFRDR